MQYAIVSDVHANLQAWKSVLLDIRSLGIDKIVCLGDIVGYGPNPAEVLKSVHSNVDHLVLGNHDAVICGKIDPALFNPHARDIILWTKDQLNDKAISFLRGLPLSLSSELFRCAHGDLSNPGAFLYVFDPADAMPSWNAVDQQLLFTGHTHEPAIFLLGMSGTPRVTGPQDFQLEDGKRYLVNVGSVGQPRDEQTRACYCILDTDTGTIIWRNIPFDLDAYREAANKAGIAVEASIFLDHDPRETKQPLRELVDFSPAASAEDAVQNTVEVCELDQLKRSVARWKMRLCTVLCIGFALSAGAGLAWHRARPRPVDIRDTVMTPVAAETIPYDRNILAPLRPGFLPARPISGWSIHLGDGRKQSVTMKDTDKEKQAFILSSKSNEEVNLSSPPIKVRPGTKLAMEAFFKKQAPFEGNIALVISLEKEDANVDQFIVREPNLSRKNGWLLAKQTFTVPARTSSIEFQVRGKFTGQVQIQGLTLCRKKQDADGRIK